MTLTIISWVAVLLGFTGTWVAAKHSYGWMIGNTCCTLWLAYDLYYAIWAGAFAALVSIIINTRNWAVTRAKETPAKR